MGRRTVATRTEENEGDRDPEVVRLALLPVLQHRNKDLPALSQRLLRVIEDRLEVRRREEGVEAGFARSGGERERLGLLLGGGRRRWRRGRVHARRAHLQDDTVRGIELIRRAAETQEHARLANASRRGGRTRGRCRCLGRQDLGDDVVDLLARRGEDSVGMCPEDGRRQAFRPGFVAVSDRIRGGISSGFLLPQRDSIGRTYSSPLPCT